MLGLNILASLFLGSSLSLVITDYLLAKFDINFFTSELSQQLSITNSPLAASQTFDTVEIFLFGILSIVIFLFNSYVHKKGKHFALPVNLFYAFTSFLIFLQTRFVVHSGTTTIFLVLFLQLFYFVFSRQKVKLHLDDSNVLINGVLIGFYSLIVANLFTTSLVIPFGLFVGLPIMYASLAKPPNFLRHPGHLIFTLVAFFPFNKVALLAIAILFLTVLFVFKNVKNKHFSKTSWIYPLSLIFIFTYNPLFYLGTFDSLEEGFWLGWVQRLLSGEVIYKDFRAYHPPFLSWGLLHFMRLTKETLFHARAYFHILEIVGTFLIYLALNRLVQNRALKILTMILVLSFLASNVQNNVEIRLGTGLLAMVFVFTFIKNKKYSALLLSGIATAISFFTSIGVGLATLASLLISILLVSVYAKRRLIKSYGYYALGLLIVFTPVFTFMATRGSLGGLVSQMQYVLQLFSSGYSNAALARPELANLLEWRDVDLYFSSTSFFWDLTRMGVVGTLLYLIFGVVRKKFDLRDLYAGVLVIFNIFLFRTALGRSDKYHLLTILIPALILIVYAIERLTEKKKYIGVFLMIFITLYFARKEVQHDFFQAQIVRFQTYGNPPGIFPSYSTARMGILAFPGEDTQLEDDLVSFIQEEVQPDETLFIFPQKPELYFLANRKNSTSFDTPIIYLTQQDQKKLVAELKAQEPKIIIYNPRLGYYDIGVDKMPLVNQQINQKVLPKMW